MPLGTELNTFESITKKPRASRACDICRKKKVKCDNEQPACSNCVSYGYQCTYLEKQKKRGPQPSYPKALEDRLERLEEVLSNLAKRETTLPSEIVEEFHSIGQSLTGGNIEKNDHSVESDFDKLALEDSKYFTYAGSSSGAYLLNGGSFFNQGRLHNIQRLLGRDAHFYLHPLSLNPGFPSVELRESLLDYFFEYINPMLPTFPLGRRDKSLTNEDDTSDLLYNCIFAVASFHNPVGVLFPNPEESFFASRVFHARAKVLLDRLMIVPSIGLVQALILLSVHPQNGWLHLGMAIRYAQELGLHRALNSKNLDPIEREKRKFLWWNCVSLDRGVSSFLGRPLAIYESDCNTSLPLLPEILAKEASIDVKELGYNQRAVKSYILFIRLSQIIAKILREIHTAESTSQGKTKNSLKELNKALSLWETSLPSEFKYDPKETKLNDRHTVSLCFLHCYSLIILNRPFIPKACRKVAATHPSQLICAKAASILTYSGYYFMRDNYCIPMQNGIIFTACSVHLINSVSEDLELARISKVNLKAGIEYLKGAAKYYLDVKRSLALLDDLIKSYKIVGLEDVPSSPELYHPSDISFTSSTLGKHIQRHDSESLIIIPAEIAERVLFNSHPSNSPSSSSTCSPAGVASSVFTASVPVYSACGLNELPPSQSVNSPSSYIPSESRMPTIEPNQQLPSNLGYQENTVPGSYQSSASKEEHYPVFPDSQRNGSRSTDLFPNLGMALFPNDGLYHRHTNDEDRSNAPVLNPLQMDFNFEEWSSYISQYMK